MSRSTTQPASRTQALWPYTWGRVYRALSLPFDLLYRVAVTRTIVLGGVYLARLPRRVIFAGTHHSYADLPLLRRALTKTGARRLTGRLLVATAADGFDNAGLFGKYAVVAFGLYPLRRGAEAEASLRGLARLAGAGTAVLIFPQGTHARPEQERAGDLAIRFRPGVSFLAQALDAAVVPFGLAGTERVMPPYLEEFTGRVIAGVPVKFTRGPLAIAFGPPLTRAPDEPPRAFAARLQEASYALARQAEGALARIEDRRSKIED